MDKLHKKKVAQVLKNIPYKILGNCVYFCYYNYNVKVILDGYPFKPPVVFLNNKCISYYESPYRLVKKYEHVHKLCLCCSSISNMQNWNINHTFIDIIEQYHSFIETLKVFQKIYMIRNIKLPQEIIYCILDFVYFDTTNTYNILLK